MFIINVLCKEHCVNVKRFYFDDLQSFQFQKMTWWITDDDGESVFDADEWSIA